MNSAFVGNEELSRSRRVLSTEAETLFDLLNSSYPTQPQSLIANYNRSATEGMNKYLSAVKLNT